MSASSSDTASPSPQTRATPMTANEKPTALLVLKDGTVLPGRGVGAVGDAVGEVCFNTAITGYQEILTDPSYAGQIITFTFPHIGNVGTNDEDIETVNMAAASGVRGCILKTPITDPSNWRAMKHLDQWLKARDIVGLSDIDTRALTALIREKGMPNAVIAHAPRVIAFFRQSPGAAGTVKLYSVDVTGFNERLMPTPLDGSDPAWSPLNP